MAVQQNHLNELSEARRADLELLAQLNVGLQSMAQQHHAESLRSLAQVTELLRELMSRGDRAPPTPRTSAPVTPRPAPGTPSGRAKVPVQPRCGLCHHCLIRKDNPRSRKPCLRPPNIIPAQQEKPWPDMRAAAAGAKKTDKKAKKKEKKEKKDAKRKRVAEAKERDDMPDGKPDDPDDGFGGLEEIFSGGTFMGMGM